MFNTYEIKALDEIREWEKARPGLVLKTIDAVGKPVTVFIDNVPGPLRVAVEKAVIGFMEMLKDLSYWTYSERSIIKKSRRAGLNVHSISDMADQDIRDLDRIARGFFSTGKIIAALEGAGCGMGGLALVAADIPAIMGILFRTIQQIGSVYGFNMKDPAMTPVIMGIYSAGCCDSAAAKTAALADIHVAAAAMMGKAAYAKAAAKARTSLFLKFIEQSTGIVPAQIAQTIAKRKMTQFLPVIGAVVGAGFNFWLMSSTMTSAYMIFRKLHLDRKLAAEAAVSAIIAARAPVRRRSFKFRSR